MNISNVTSMNYSGSNLCMYSLGLLFVVHVGLWVLRTLTTHASLPRLAKNRNACRLIFTAPAIVMAM